MKRAFLGGENHGQYDHYPPQVCTILLPRPRESWVGQDHNVYGKGRNKGFSDRTGNIVHVLQPEEVDICVPSHFLTQGQRGGVLGPDFGLTYHHCSQMMFSCVLVKPEKITSPPSL